MFNVCVRAKHEFLRESWSWAASKSSYTPPLCVIVCREVLCCLYMYRYVFILQNWVSAAWSVCVCVCVLYFKCVYCVCEVFSVISRPAALSSLLFQSSQCLFVTLHKYFGESAAAKSFFFRWSGEQTCWRRLRFLNRPQHSCCSKDTNTMNTA